MKTKILSFIGNYLPGFKSGGILRSVVNTVNTLNDEFEFWIVTKDRDLGDVRSYPGIKLNQWQKVGNAMVYYVPPGADTLKEFAGLINSTPHHIIFLNSFFELLTIKVLLIRKLNKIDDKAVIVSPRGEFAWASLRLKYPKKFAFIHIARMVGLYDNVTWHASSEFEKADIMKIMRIRQDMIHVAQDLPVRITDEGPVPEKDRPAVPSGGMRLVFLSRISREKNLDYALKVLTGVKASVVFDIYGPPEDKKYWEECQVQIGRLPSNVTANYLGSVLPDEVPSILSGYDLLFFPSGGENYGHVIAESLTSGTPVLISDKTPWKNLADDSLGWDIPLNRPDSFIEIIERFAGLTIKERLSKRALVRENIIKRLADTSILEANRLLFTRQLLINKGSKK